MDLSKVVDQSRYGTNTSYLVDFLQITLLTKLLDNNQIHDFYTKKGLSAAQIAVHFGVGKTVIYARLHAMGIREGTNPKRRTNPENYRCHMAPYGYSIKNGRLVLNKAELRICRLVVNLIGHQSFSASATAQELSRRGFKNRAGRTNWDHSTILNIFRRWKDKL